MTIPLLIDGKEHSGVGFLAREDPANPDVEVGRVATADPAIVASAIGAAEAAYAGWSNVPAPERVATVQQAVAAASLSNPSRAQLLTRELGKVIADATGELGFAKALAAYAGPIVERLSTDTVLEDAEGLLVTVPEPFGVVAAITPWNAPVILAALKIVPGIMTGNTFVLKPSPLAPLAVTEFLSEVARGLPAGVLNVVNGGADVGQALVSDNRIAKVSFTGGLVTARHIAVAAANNVRPTVMELGGNDAAIFLPDADFSDAVMQRAVFGAFLSSGQVCMAMKRIFVPAARRTEFIEGFVAAAARVLRIGDPLDAASTMGPVVTREHQQRILGLVDSARAAGAQIHELGDFQPTSGPDGYWVRPTLVDGLADNHQLVADEQFGPTVPLLTYDSLDEVVARANSVDQALASSVWSVDEEKAYAVARRIRAGYTFINCHNRAGISLRATFGGRGVSGHGREFGEAGIAEYLQSHSINSPNSVRSGGALGNAYPVPASAA